MNKKAHFIHSDAPQVPPGLLLGYASHRTTASRREEMGDQVEEALEGLLLLGKDRPYKFT